MRCLNRPSHDLRVTLATLGALRRRNSSSSVSRKVYRFVKEKTLDIESKECRKKSLLVLNHCRRALIRSRLVDREIITYKIHSENSFAEIGMPDQSKCGGSIGK